jgi:hypothetical protein
MDPDATLGQLIDSVLAEDWSGAIGDLFALKHWVEHGGFGPTDPRHPDPMPPASWPPPQLWSNLVRHHWATKATNAPWAAHPDQADLRWLGSRVPRG